MKRLIFAVLAVIVMATPVVNAQKINKPVLLDKIAKADATVNDAKKGKKAASWISRGDAYFKAATEPTKELFAGVGYSVVEVAWGLPESKTDGVVINGNTFTEMVYPWAKIYVANNQVITWEQTQFVKEGDLVMEAFNSYMKAYAFYR